MLALSLQSMLLIAAGVGLFRLWRAAVPSERWLHLAVAAGFLARAFLGQALFWISWARLPIARSLQLGDGFWVFAQDALWYFPQAAHVAHIGPWAIVMYDRAASSVMYEQLLATFIWLFGSAVSVALLINLFCYLGTVAILVRWSRTQPRTATAAALAIVAITFSPAFVLWALQPLKDPFFQLLFVAFVATCAAWQRAWVVPGRWAARLGTASLLAVLLFALAGIRWYFAAVLVGAASLFMLLVAFQSAERRLVSLAAAGIVTFLLSQSLAVSAAPYLPERLRAILNPRTTLHAMKTAPASILGSLEQVRNGFDHTAASTAIRTGERLKTKSAPSAAPVVNVVKETAKPQTKPVAPAPPSKPQPVKVAGKPAAKPHIATTTIAATSTVPTSTQPVVAPPPPNVAVPEPAPVADATPASVLKALPESELAAEDVANVRAVLEAEAAAWNRKDLQSYMSWWWTSPKFEFQHGDTVVHDPHKVSEYLARTYSAKGSSGQVAMAGLRMTGTPGNVALVRGRWTVTMPDREPFTGRLEALLRRFPEGWKVVRLRLPQSAEPDFPAVAEPVMVDVELLAPQQVAHSETPRAPQPVARATPPATATAHATTQPPVARAAKPHVSPRPLPPPAPAPALPPQPAFTDADAAQIRAVLAAQAAAWDRNDLGGYMATYSRAPELADGAAVVRGRQPVIDYYKTNFTRDGRLGTLAFSSINIVGAATGATAAISGQCKLTAADGDGRAGDFAMQMQRLPEGWRVVKTIVPLNQVDERATQSRGTRLLAGAAVLILPRSVGERLGLFHIGGGRGMLWFTEIDTIVFDVVLLCALLALVARSSAPWRNPLTWLVLLITLLIFGPLAYSISNFGTLFRLREMIYVGLLLVPLAVAARAERPQAPAE